MKRLVVVIFLGLIIMSSTSDTQKKIFRHGDYEIECYVYLKQLEHFDNNKKYHWFKSSELHTSMGKSGGLVLHDEFLKYYKSNQLAEKGAFDYGLKDGEWKEWYENGKMRSITNWKNGFKHGVYKRYDANGNIELTGYFDRNDSVRRWVNYKQKDTTYYKNGESFKSKPDSFIDNVFKKRDSIEKAEKKKKREIKRQERKAKDSWLKRLFSSKKKDSIASNKK